MKNSTRKRRATEAVLAATGGLFAQVRAIASRRETGSSSGPNLFTLPRAVHSFGRSERGNLGVVFAIVATPLMFVAGAAVDYSRAATLRTRLQAGADGTSLTLCQTKKSTTTTQLKEMAEKKLKAYLPNASASVEVTNDPRKVTLTTRTKYETAFVRIAGFDTIDLTAVTGCQLDERFFEIALVLDNTGSMSVSDGTMSKMDALKKASTNFVNFMFSNAALAERTKVSLVPFSAGVAVNPTTYRNAVWIDQKAQSRFHWQNISGAAAAGFTNRLAIFSALRTVNLAWDWAGCFEALPYPLNVQDVAPTPSNPDSYYVPMFSPDEVGNGGESWRWDPSFGWRFSSNSYIDDETTTAGCETTPPDNLTRWSRACKYVNAKNPRTVGYYADIGPNWMCSSLPLTQLTSSQSTLLSQISLMKPAGNTDIHEGVVWGWRTLSPNSVFAEGAPYTQKNNTKVIVLMTDGYNTWNNVSAYNDLTYSFYSSYGYYKNLDGSTPNDRLPPANANPRSDGQARAGMDALTLQTCQNAASAGVVIYTIGFSIPQAPIDQNGLTMLQTCAGSKDRAFVANDSAALISIFSKIAESIASPRLVN